MVWLFVETSASVARHGTSASACLCYRVVYIQKLWPRTLATHRRNGIPNLSGGRPGEAKCLHLLAVAVRVDQLLNSAGTRNGCLDCIKSQ